MAGGKRADPDLKAQLQVGVSAGESVQRAARRLGISYSTAKGWARELRPDRPEKEKADEYSRLVAEILLANLRACLAIATVLGDGQFLRTAENAQQLAFAYGILADKSARIADRLDAERDEAGPGEFMAAPTAPGGADAGD